MQAVGHLQYLQNTLFPELSYSVKVASKFNKAPCKMAWIWIKEIMAWLKGQTWAPYIIKGGAPDKMYLSSWSDSNHAKDPDHRKSLGGHIIRLWDDLIDYGSCTQQIVSHSAAESELMALDVCVRRTQYMVWLVESMGAPKQGAVKVYIDCASVIDWACSPINPTRNCHVHARFFYVRDMQNAGIVVLIKVASAKNWSDLMVTFKGKENFQFLSVGVKEGRAFIL